MKKPKAKSVAEGLNSPDGTREENAARFSKKPIERQPKRSAYGDPKGGLVESLVGPTLYIIHNPPTFGADLPAASIAAAAEWLDKNWKWPLDRETLVRGIVAAYQEAESAKR